MSALPHYYLLILFIFTQCLFIKKLGKCPILVLIALELWFLSAFRGWDVGNDTWNYIGAFVHMYSPFPDVFGTGHMEQGYRLFNQFVGFFSHNPQTILIVTSAIIISSRFLSIARYSAYAGFTTVLFVIMQFGNTLNLVRQEIAFSIVLFAFPFVVKRQFIPYLVACWLASQIHLTAIMAIPIYFFYTLPWQKKYIVSIVLGGILGLVLLAPLLNAFIDITGRYEGYLGSNYALGEDVKLGSILSLFVALAVFTFEIVSYQIHKQKFSQPVAAFSKSFPVTFLLFMGLITLCLNLIALRAAGLSRVAFYYNFFTIFSLPIFIQAYRYKTRIFVILAVVGGLIAHASVIFIFRPTWNHWLPYHFYF